MVNPIPSSVQKIWEDWNIRGLMLFSLSLQTILILLAPFRKGNANKLIIILLWSVYLLADWAANFAVGLICDSQRDAPHPSTPAENSHLLAFWPPFLLLHLGGPDTITAFSLEDNELWIRHLLGLGFQAIATVYVFLLSLPENKLAVPTLLMFIAGIIKYLERTRALYLASMDRFRDSMLKEPDPGPNYAKLMDDIVSKKEANLPTTVIMLHEQYHEESNHSEAEKRGELDDHEVVHFAYHYFQIFKGLIVDLIFSFHERNESRKFFLNLSAEDALRVIEVELNFIYDALYTKVHVVHSRLGYCLRFISFASVVAAFSLFHFKVEKSGFDEFDVRITYTLFLGAVALDTLGFFMLGFSDWTSAALYHPADESNLKIKWFLVLKRPRWSECQKHGRCQVLATPFLLRRWSGCLSQHNLIRYCLEGRPTNIHKVKNCAHRVIEKFIRGFNGARYCLKGCPTNFHKVKNCVHRVFEKFIPGFSGGRYCLKGCPTNFHKVKNCVQKLFLGFSGGRYCLQGCPTNFHKVKNCVHRLFEKFIPGFSGGKIIPTGSRGSHFIDGKAIHIEGRVGRIYNFICGQVIHLFSSIVNQVIDCFGLTEFMDEIRYLAHEPLTKELWEFVFAELQKKSEHADDPKDAKATSSSRGDLILKEILKEKSPDLQDVLLAYLTGVAYDESLLLWHIATELLYHTEGKDANKYCEFSKVLSDYMMYLLVMHPAMMSAEAGIGKIRFRDTCAEAKRFFKSKDLGANDETTACKEILSVNTYVKPAMVKGDKSKSVLFDASMLAQVLINDFEKGTNEDKWELVSKIWVELVSYAACNCITRTHAQQVSKGGEFITFVWLLMAHFGIGRQFQINKGHGRTKLIVGK